MNSDKQTALQLAVIHLNTGAVSSLTNHPEIDVNVTDKFNSTALHHLCSRKITSTNLMAATSIMELLLRKTTTAEKGTRSKEPDEQEARSTGNQSGSIRNPLQLAAENGNWWLVGMMLASGINAVENRLNEDQLLNYTMKFLNFIEHLDQMNILQEKVDQKVELYKDNISDARYYVTHNRFMMPSHRKLLLRPSFGSTCQMQSFRNK